MTNTIKVYTFFLVIFFIFAQNLALCIFLLSSILIQFSCSIRASLDAVYCILHRDILANSFCESCNSDLEVKLQLPKTTS